MKRCLVSVAALAFLFGAAACSDADREEAAEDIRESAEDAYEEGREAVGDAANRAEDVINDRIVRMKDVAFVPQSRTVKIGTEVTWTNNDAVTHTVTADNDAFDSGNVEGTKEFSFRFTQAGEYPYHCEIHGKDRMSGTVVVES